MLKQIDVVYEGDEGLETYTLPVLTATAKSSVIVRKVTGLEPPTNSLFVGEYSRDGGTYQGRRTQVRNVVITVDLNPSPALGQTVSSLRQELYRIFMDPQVESEYVQLVLTLVDGSELYVIGYTETIESEIFGVETSMQISMVCPDPFIRDSVGTVLYNETGTWKITPPFAYLGTAKSGFETQLQVDSAVSRIALVLNNRSMIVEHDFVTNDVIYLNTNVGELDIRRASGTDFADVQAAYPEMTLAELWETLRVDGQTTPLVGGLANSSRWLQLKSKSNVIAVHGSAFEDGLVGVKALQYRAAYWGL